VTDNADRARTFVDHVARADDAVLVALARHAHTVPRPPVFYGRSLEPAFLDAVASGQWTPADQGLLRAVQHRVEAVGLHRVPRRHRRGLRRALRATAVSLLTESVASARWQHRRTSLAQPWACTFGPLPLP
jgi:hypothetical protein